MLMKLKKNKKGFTLAELLIVIAIIAILIAIAIPVFSGALDTAKKAADDANIRAAYSQYVITKMTAGADVGSATATEATAAFTAIGVSNLQYYSGVNITINSWKGGAKGSGSTPIEDGIFTVT